MNQKELIKEIRDDVKDTKSRINEILVEIAAIKIDVQHHIKRTDQAEDRIEKMENFKWYFTGLAVIITTIASVIIKFI